MAHARTVHPLSRSREASAQQERRPFLAAADWYACTALLLNDTTNTKQNTLVPGGQRYYVHPSTGALGFTQAHSGSEPIGAIHDIYAFEKGAFQVQGSEGWMACPTKIGTAPSLQILAKLPGLSFAAECFQISLLTVDWNGQGPSAWQYT
jgi:hypothetical protein